MRKHTTSLLLALAVLTVPAVPAFGADALVICQSGVPFAYPNGGANILWNPDLGDLGPLSNAQAVAAVDQAFDAWENISTSSATFLQGPFVAVDIDINNYVPILNGLFDGESPIVFDEDGSIFTALFGAGTGILGFAGPEFGNFATCELLEGSAWLNGPEFDDAVVAEDIMVHEFGHYINLGHTELNGQLINFSEGGDDSGPTPDNATFGTTGFVGTEVVDTMYPFYFSAPFPGVGTRTPHADDIASISFIYPDASYANRGSISGAILAPDGVTRLSGVNVIARNINDPFVDSVSTFSGAYTNSTSQADPNVGLFTLGNLNPGEQYAVFVDVVTAQPGRFSNPILTQLPGPEEFWNAAESSDPNTDPPLDYTLITASAAGAPGTDIIFNQPGEGQPLPVGDDGFVSLFMPFTFTICDQDFSQVFVNANGNLTFGSGDTDFSESTAEFLNDQPRIAGLWDDLNPNAGGTVFFTTTSNTFDVTWDNVPEWLATGSNTFTISLKKDANEVAITYGDLGVNDGLAGISCGGDVTGGLEQPQELVTVPNSRTINVNDETAIFELNAGSDLDGYRLKFANQSHALMDKNEPNDSFAKATAVVPPYNTAPNSLYTAIDPPAGDVDYYSFSAAANDVIIAETVRGNLDTVIGVFDSDGNLLNNPVADDDAGAGLLSRAAVVISASGTYYVAVSFCCDYDLDGVDPGQGLPFDGGRYVLDLVVTDQLDLAVGDDGFAEIPLGFGFPYQGSTYTSAFVNANGNITFGSGDTDFSESVGEFLNDQPRIAAAWDDLNPNAGGSVYASYTVGSVTVTWEDVPEWLATGANTFSVTLEPSGDVTIDYGAMGINDAIAGITEGGGAVAVETDLSAGGPYSKSGTTYEQFTGAGDPLDLAGDTLDFDQP
jgi:hypothetical protein